MNDGFVIPKTYSGLLDDVVDRHRITPEVDGTFFNRSLIRNLFFSGPVFLNDGYLVNHPAALEQVLDEDSLLRSLIKNRFVELLVRQPDAEAFARNPERMAARGVISFRRLVDRRDWPDIRRKLERWADGYYSENRLVPWPNFQMHVGFRRLFHRIFDKDLDDLGLAHIPEFRMDEFRALYEAHESFTFAPRTAVEESLLALQAEGKLKPGDVADVMNIANQCYHYNFAMCLTRAENHPVVADTTIGKAFEDILDLDQAVEADVSSVPVLSVPRGFPMDKGSFFEVFLDPGSDVNIAKREFLTEMERVFRPGGNQDARQQVEMASEASRAYREALAGYFSGKVGLSDWAPRRGALVTFGLGKLGSAFGANLEYAMLAANLALGSRAASFVHRMTRPLNKRILDVAFNPDAGDENKIDFTVGEIRPRFASLAFDRVAVENHTAALPPMT